MDSLHLHAAALAIAVASVSVASAQSPDDGVKDKITVHGSVQADVLSPTEPITIGSQTFNDDVYANLYAGASVFSKYIDAGVRFEYLEHAMPAFWATDPNYKGWGVPNIYVRGKYKGAEITVGDFYDQFGSGFILRTYEERSLGIDNSIRGARLQINTVPGMRITALGGVQRADWDWSTKAQLVGANYEIDLQDFAKSMRNHSANLTLGASYVMRHENNREEILVPGTNYRLNLPSVVNAFDVRANYQQHGWGLLAEYAFKGQDPSLDNGYTYGNGHAVLLSGSYSRSGFSAMVQAKRSENFAFRSQRSEQGVRTLVNNLPPFAYTHTYTLAAMYPYATQNNPGEWAFQGALSYTFKRKTALGGRYGTTIKLNGSWIRGLSGHMSPAFHGSERGTDGLRTKFFGMGDGLYHDINVTLEKRICPWFSFNFMYMNQMYNQFVVEGHGSTSVKSNIFVYDGKYKLSKKVTLRTELQYLQTKQDNGDWLNGLAEVSVLPYLMFTAADTWNVGGDRGHFYTFGVTANYKANRLMVAYGRTRDGYNCSGGVCRYVPESKGFTINYNYNF